MNKKKAGKQRVFGFKAINPDGRAAYQYYFYKIPPNEELGEWLSVKGKLSCCGKGFHFCRTASEIKRWGSIGHDVWLVELDGNILDGGSKGVARRIRLIKKIGRLTERRWMSWFGEWDGEEYVKKRHPSSWLRTVEHQVKVAQEELTF